MSLGKRSGKREMLRVYILYMYIMYIIILLMKMNDKLMLGFQENQTFLHVLSRNYQLFMYTACDLLKV